MIVIRNVFRLKFGKAREAVALFKEGLAIQKRVGAGLEFSTRLLTDVSGPFYTVVLEITVPSAVLAATVATMVTVPELPALRAPSAQVLVVVPVQVPEPAGATLVHVALVTVSPAGMTSVTVAAVAC